MPNFSSIIQNKQPIIQVIIFPNSKTIQNDHSSWKSNIFKALSVITSNVIKSLELIPIGNATHSIIANSYQAVVGIPIIELIDKNRGIGQLLAKFFNLQVTEMPNLGQNFDMLIGMDIVQRCLIVIHNNTLIFSF